MDCHTSYTYLQLAPPWSAGQIAMASKTFTVRLSTSSEPRAARRVLFNSDILKAAKLSTGELVALSGGVASDAVGKMLWIPAFLLIESPIEICCWDCLAISRHSSRRFIISYPDATWSTDMDCPHVASRFYFFQSSSHIRPRGRRIGSNIPPVSFCFF